MAEENTVHAVVAESNYVYRGQAIPQGRVVRMSSAQFEETQQTQPSYFREAKEDEVKRAETILDLSTVSGPKATNVEAAEAGATPKSPSSRSRG